MNKEDLPVFQNNEELPLTLNARDIAGYLNVSISCAYQVMNSRNFPVISVYSKSLYFQAESKSGSKNDKMAYF